MTVTIGIDPHKASHATCAFDNNEQELAQLSVRAGQRQLEQLLGWAKPLGARTWAVESAGGLGYLLAQQLVGAAECVVDVPATLSSRVRLLGTGRSNKNDPNDARAVAIAALRAPSLAAVRREDHVTVLRLLAKAHLDTGPGPTFASSPTPANSSASSSSTPPATTSPKTADVYDVPRHQSPMSRDITWWT